MLRIWFIILIIFACDVCGAQSFYSKRYRASDGLNTDMIKAVAEDQHGFIWIGSDNGLIRYDGNSFITYPKATSSTYIKDFLTRQDGALWAVHDLGIVEIRNKLDTVIFKPVLKGSRKKTDSTIWYPKQAYEDNKGNIWIA